MLVISAAIEQYGTSHPGDRPRLQAMLAHILDVAAGTAGLAADWRHGYAAVAPDTDTGPFLDTLAAVLSVVNMGRTPVRLRLAADHTTGPPARHAAQLCDAAALLTAMAARPATALGAILFAEALHSRHARLPLTPVTENGRRAYLYLPAPRRITLANRVI
ncbi:hypothetical protein [Sinosporangium siamense]|uniref:Uncharacterized protein n=1 Tax=Sinosporangium siamense TaxID=1367973 RepID=A0A919RLQ3_9ACTN|nr:hypothetical protein [Sinosporangium siamense]GII96112.1 hypothetical protein Ssi02_63430 [Sinosporangium siamense]